jgi:DNA-binding CsgD family transcriptional regulator
VDTTSAVGAGRRRIIKRPRLTRMLDESGARIILLVAPAGYGKTTLAHEWLDERRSAWYQGSTASADVAALAVGLATAAAEIVPGAGERMRQRLRATDRPEEEAQILAEMLAEDLGEWPNDAWLAIDDYHLAMEAQATNEFVATLMETAPIRLVITTRVKPGWVTARRLVYGEILELDGQKLAMSDEEALEVLQSTNSPRVLRKAQGWPAVIGLAALADGALASEDDLSASLADYFAQEIYNAAEPGLQWELCQLAVAPSITSDLAQFLFGDDTARRVLDQAQDQGILTRAGAHGFDLHPLVREFLRARALDYGEAQLTQVVERMGQFLLRSESWDDCFELTERFGSPGLLVELVKAASTDVLAEGRLATLERWLAYATTQHIKSPFLDLAAADVMLRQARYTAAETLAVQAAHASSPGTSNRFLSRAYSIAGHSAHLANREDEALRYYEEAERAAADAAQLRDALWGQLLCALDLDRTDLDLALHRLESVQAETVDDSLRVATGKLFLALRQGTGLDVDLLREPLIEQTGDPLVRSSFLNAWVFALGFSGRYSEALEASDLQIAEANQYRLSFALPHAYLTRGLALRGLSQFRQAHAWFDQAESVAGVEGRATATQIARALTLAAEARPADAVSLLKPEPQVFPTQSLRSEYLASLALALAAVGCFEDSLERASEALGGPKSVEAQVLAACTKAIVAIRRGNLNASDLAKTAFEVTMRTGNVDSFVCAYRVVPDLAVQVSGIESARYELGIMMGRANDNALARSLGLAPSSSFRPTPNQSLSPRENDVYDLLARGLSNRAIAQALFISEATVKVHVRRILEKLGVETRTQAALRAAQDARS